MWTGGREFRNNYKIFKTIKLFGELGCLYSKRGGKAEYDARTAAGWGKTGAVRNFCNDADYWEKQQKKY